VACDALQVGVLGIDSLSITAIFHALPGRDPVRFEEAELDTT